jgi:hypothetical protein
LVDDGADLYANGVAMDEAQLQAAFAAYHAELDELPPPAERDTVPGLGLHDESG